MKKNIMFPLRELFQHHSIVDSPNLFDFNQLFNENHAGSLNIYQQEDKQVIEVSVPGFTKENIDVHFDENNKALIIKGVKEQTSERQDDYHIKEFSSTNFQRIIQLGDNCEIKDVNLNDGLLRIITNKPEIEKDSSHLKKIDIK